MGLRDYMGKNGFRTAALGLSGVKLLWDGVMG